MRANKCRALCALSISALLSVVPPIDAAQESPPIVATNAGSDDQHTQENHSFKLPPNALQVARLIGVDSDISRLAELTAAGSGPVSSMEELSLRQRITDAVVVASLDADSVMNETRYEWNQIAELTSILRTRRDRATGTSNLGVLVASVGLGVVGGALAINDATSDVGNGIAFGSGALGALISLRSIRQRHDLERPAWVLPNMLAGFLGQPQEPHSRYPADVWAYLNSVPPGEHSQASRKDLLLSEWAAGGRIGPQDSPKTKQKIELLTSTNAAEKKLNFEVLNERGAMLADVQDEVAQMKRDLADLLRGLQSH